MGQRSVQMTQNRACWNQLNWEISETFLLYNIGNYSTEEWFKMNQCRAHSDYGALLSTSKLTNVTGV